jgi:hypothetical protein
MTVFLVLLPFMTACNEPPRGSPDGAARANEQVSRTVGSTSEIMQRPEQPAATRKLYPIDEAQLDPTFAEFRVRLLAALKKRDLAFAETMLAPEIWTIDGKVSGRNFAAQFAREESPLWRELEAILSTGATRSSRGFCAPYFVTRFPRDLNAFEFLVITSENVKVRSEPKSTAPTIETLSYDIVQIGPEGNILLQKEEIGGETHHWVEIATPSGRRGYVYAKYAASPLGEAACFEKVGDTWILTSLMARD